MPFSLIKRGLFFPHQVECCIAYGMLISSPYQLRTGNSAVFYWPRTQMADSNGYRRRRKKNRPESPARLIWNESVIASGGSGTRNSKCNPDKETTGGKVRTVISDTYLGNHQGLRTASGRRFCVWWNHLTQLAILQWRETFPCITCRDRRASSRVERTCSPSLTQFKLSPSGRNSAGLRFGLH